MEKIFWHRKVHISAFVFLYVTLGTPSDLLTSVAYSFERVIYVIAVQNVSTENLNVMFDNFLHHHH